MVLEDEKKLFDLYGYRAEDDWRTGGVDLSRLPQKDNAPTVQSVRVTQACAEARRRQKKEAQLERLKNLQLRLNQSVSIGISSTESKDDSSPSRKRPRDDAVVLTPNAAANAASNRQRSNDERIENETEDNNDMFFINDVRKKLIYAREYRKIEQQLAELHTRETVPFENDNGHIMCDGDKRLRHIRTLLSTFSEIRSEQQKEFHDKFLIACLPHIYGKDWEAHRIRVLEQFKIKRIRFEVMAVTPRRFGKSWAVAMFCAALLLAVPSIRICVFSTGKRASGSLMELVTKFINKVPGGNERICKKTEEQLFLANVALAAGSGVGSAAAKLRQTDDATSKLFSFPSSVKGKSRYTRREARSLFVKCF